MYRFGLKDISISDVGGQIGKMKEIVGNSPGFEIIDSTKNSLRVIDIGNTNEETIKKAEHQIYWKLTNLIEKVIEKKSSREEIYQFDMEINRLAFFVERSLALHFSPNQKTFLEYEKISILEDIGDSIRHYNKYAKKSEEELNVLREISSMIDELRSFETKVDLKVIGEFKDKIEKLKKKLKIDEKKPNISFVFLLEIIGNVSNLYENLIAFNIEKVSVKED